MRFKQTSFLSSICNDARTDWTYRHSHEHNETFKPALSSRTPRAYSCDALFYNTVTTTVQPRGLGLEKQSRAGIVVGVIAWGNRECALLHALSVYLHCPCACVGQYQRRERQAAQESCTSGPMDAESDTEVARTSCTSKLTAQRKKSRLLRRACSPRRVRRQREEEQRVLLH